MEAASRQALGPFLGYLRQEGLGEDVPWAVVDSGWMGSTQDTLGEALTLLGRPGSPRGYYAGLYRAPRRGQWEGFFFQPGERLAIQAGFEPSLWEAAFAAPTARCWAMVRGTAALSPCWGRLVPPRRRPGWRKLLPSGGNIWPGSPGPGIWYPTPGGICPGCGRSSAR